MLGCARSSPGLKENFKITFEKNQNRTMILSLVDVNFKLPVACYIFCCQDCDIKSGPQAFMYVIYIACWLQSASLGSISVASHFWRSAAFNALRMRRLASEKRPPYEGVPKNRTFPWSHLIRIFFLLIVLQKQEINPHNLIFCLTKSLCWLEHTDWRLPPLLWLVVSNRLGRRKQANSDLVSCP